MFNFSKFCSLIALLFCIFLFSLPKRKKSTSIHAYFSKIPSNASATRPSGISNTDGDSNTSDGSAGVIHLSVNKPSSVSCNGVMPLKNKERNNYLTHVVKYASNSSLMYSYRLIGSQGNLFSKGCPNSGVPSSDKRHPGVRCVNCKQLFSEKSWKLWHIIDQQGKLFIEALRCIYNLYLTDTYNEIMHKFKQVKSSDLSMSGIELQSKVRSLHEFYKEAKVRIYSL